MNFFQGAANRGPCGHEGRHPAGPHVCRDGENIRIHVQNSLEICCRLEDLLWHEIHMYSAKSLLRVRYFCVYRYTCKKIQSMELEYGDIMEQTKNFYDKSIQVISYCILVWLTTSLLITSFFHPLLFCNRIPKMEYCA
jgi:hypothetical protein